MNRKFSVGLAVGLVLVLVLRVLLGGAFGEDDGKVSEVIDTGVESENTIDKDDSEENDNVVDNDDSEVNDNAVDNDNSEDTDSTENSGSANSSDNIDSGVEQDIIEETTKKDFDYQVDEIGFTILTSSTLTETIGGEERVYSCANVFDDETNTIWAEGERFGDGSGAWIEFRSGEVFDLNTLEITNGFTKNERVYYENNRFTQARLYGSNGEEVLITATDGNLDLSSYEINMENITGFRLVFDKIRLGSRYNDLCISEIRINGQVPLKVQVEDYLADSDNPFYTTAGCHEFLDEISKSLKDGLKVLENEYVRNDNIRTKVEYYVNEGYISKIQVSDIWWNCSMYFDEYGNVIKIEDADLVSEYYEIYYAEDLPIVAEVYKPEEALEYSNYKGRIIYTFQEYIFPRYLTYAYELYNGEPFKENDGFMDEVMFYK